MSNSFAVEDARKEAGYLQILFRLISLRDKKIITDAEFDRPVEYYKKYAQTRRRVGVLIQKTLLSSG